MKSSCDSAGERVAGNNSTLVEFVRLQVEEADQRVGLPTRIGRYRIHGVLGSGGMGIVYRATQDKVRREVALKVIRPDLVSPARFRRFAQEVELLGRLQHPGIAQVYDAEVAVTPIGPQPFLAMELVAGEPLTRYAESRTIGVRERLELLGKVCDAVHHAHERAVVHRDLKPSNIIVQESGQPKILDFGVARATDSEHRATTTLTTTNQLIGTLRYMSPEQVDGRHNSVDARSDVYSLGVVACELLTGQLPYELDRKSVVEAARIIRDHEPSSLTTQGRRLGGDVLAILLKALEKSPDRRYQSALAMSADIHRFLDNKPTLARKPSSVDQFRKFVSRHKLTTTLVSMMLLLVLGSAVAMYIMWSQAESAAREARRDNSLLRRAHMWASELRVNAPNLRPLPAFPSGPQHVAAIIDGQPPETQVVLHSLAARMCSSLFRDDEALVQARQALDAAQSLPGNNDPIVADCTSHLGTLLCKHGDGKEGLQLIQEAIELRRTMFEDDPLSLAESILNASWLFFIEGDGVRAEDMLRESLAICRDVLGDENLLLAVHLDLLGNILVERGKVDEAEAAYREELTIRQTYLDPLEPTVLANRGSLAGLLWLTGRYEEAEAEYREIITLESVVLGDTHVAVAQRYNNLGVTLRDQGKYGEAGQALRRSISIYRDQERMDELCASCPLLNLAWVAFAQGDLQSAEPMFREVLRVRREHSVATNFDEAEPLIGLAQILLRRGDAESATPMLAEALRIRRSRKPPGHWLIGEAMSALGACQAAVGRDAEAEKNLLEGYRIIRNKRTMRCTATVFAMHRVVVFYCLRGRYAEAGAYLIRATGCAGGNYSNNDI